MAIRLIILSILLFFIEIYSFQAFKTVLKIRWVLGLYTGISLIMLGFILYTFSKFDFSVGQTKLSLTGIGALILIYLPKLIITLFMFSEDIYRIFAGVIDYFLAENASNFLPERRKFVSQIGIGIAAVPFLSLIYGMTIGKYNYKVIKQRLFYSDLPEAFDGFKILQISDIHSGSFDNPEKINYAVDLINQQTFDILLFTGDIVNARAEEMHPWLETFNRLKKPEFGKYSILGNHDYGAYLEWKSDKAKADNFIAIKDLHRQIDFKLMLNQHIKIKKNDAEIALIGVENWGKHFGEYGDIDKASEGLSKDDFKVLMSHDPSHWEFVVKNHPKHFQLTLSGHTHGMQFGIEIPGYIKWSLAQYLYKQWAGLYQNAGRFIYVNRGFGFHAYPGRVGIMPEITVLELKKQKNRIVL
jgi:uncharacterized protein